LRYVHGKPIQQISQNCILIQHAPHFNLKKSYSIFGAGITQFGIVTGQGLESQPIRAWILAEARNLSLLIVLNSSKASFHGGKATGA
jgi:hypothetical protein